MRFIGILAAFAALVIGPATAQQTGSDAMRASPELTARIDGVVGDESKALDIGRLAIEVRLHGSIALTEMTVRFDNPSDQVLEGQFAIDLPKGSVVTGYALDVGGDMIDGVLQPRDRAREAFERRVVQRIDPGLGEVDFSDRFESRVYPIFARNGRTIRIRFASPLEADGHYRLPLDTADVDEWSISVEGREPASARGLDWRREGRRWSAGGKGALDTRIVVAAPMRPGMTVSEHPGEGRFFELVGEAGRGKRSGGPLTIVWDRSVSRLDDALEREAELAHALARRMDVESVRLVQFDSGAMSAANVATGDLEGRLGAVRYAGGTRYAGLDALLAERRGTCVLFSDGRATLQARESLAGAKCRLFAVTSGKEADRAWLEAQTRAGGGTVIDLNTTNNGAALEALMRPSTLPRIAGADGKAIAVRALPASNGLYRVVGPLPRGGAVTVGDRRVTAPSPAVPGFAGPGALWASQHLATMRDTVGIEALAEEARRWSVATPGVSFIVLETPEDYAQSGFVPPDTYPKPLRARFDAVREQRQRAEKAQEKAHYRQLLDAWRQRREWWRTGRVATPEPRAVPRNDLPMPPPPPPAMPVAAPPPAVSPRPEPEENIVVTGSRIRETVERVTSVDVESADASSASAPDQWYAGLDGSATGVVTAEWSADRPYIAEWSQAGENWRSAVAATQKEHGELPLFYLDLAEWHWSAGRQAEARRAAAAALDLPARDNQTLEIVAQRLLRYGARNDAIWLLEQLLDREAERPHPTMALAQALAERGRATDARNDLVRAQDLLRRVAMQPWDGQYGMVGEIALAEANQLIVELGGPQAQGVSLDPAFIDPMPVDLRVVAIWNTPRTDLDLWVREPSGEEVGYNHRGSRAGARYTHDITQGFGPEEYQLRKAPDGTYRVEVNTFAVDRRNPNGPSTITVRLIRDFGTAKAREETIDVEMTPDAQGRKLIGTIDIG